MAILGGQLFATGGQTPDGRATASVERYDPVSETWHYVTPMRRPRFSHACAAHGGKLYVVGGFAGGEWLTATERYDPEDGPVGEPARPRRGRLGAGARRMLAFDFDTHVSRRRSTHARARRREAGRGSTNRQ